MSSFLSEAEVELALLDQLRTLGYRIEREEVIGLDGTHSERLATTRCGAHVWFPPISQRAGLESFAAEFSAAFFGLPRLPSGKCALKTFL